MFYTIQQVAQKTGLSTSTLRYYEAEGLLQRVARDGANRRTYGQEDLDWLSIITCLKNTGMPILEIRRFVILCGQGDTTLQQRHQLLLAHREATKERIEQLQNEMAHINAKVAYYEAACAANCEAVANATNACALLQSSGKPGRKVTQKQA